MKDKHLEITVKYDDKDITVPVFILFLCWFVPQVIIGILYIIVDLTSFIREEWLP